MQKDEQKPCSFLVVTAGVPAQLGISDAKTLELLSMNCKSKEQSQNRRQINGQTTIILVQESQ